MFLKKVYLEQADVWDAYLDEFGKRDVLGHTPVVIIFRRAGDDRRAIAQEQKIQPNEGKQNYRNEFTSGVNIST